MSTSLVEPLNATNWIHHCVTNDYADLNIVFENGKLYENCIKNLGESVPTYANLNR